MTSPTAIAGYLALFTGAGFLFLFINLLIGNYFRPHAPNVEKLEVYECGEPTIGSSFVQFDLRFYVVALLFIIFDVEIAFFFPWANVFGKSTQLMDPNFSTVVSRSDAQGAAASSPAASSNPAPSSNLVTGTRSLDHSSMESSVELSPAARDLYRELGVRNPTLPSLSDADLRTLNARLGRTASPVEQGQEAVTSAARKLAFLSMMDILVFFGVLMVGFAYVWRRGDLDWVRAVSRERAEAGRSPPRNPTSREAVLSA